MIIWLLILERLSVVISRDEKRDVCDLLDIKD